jgi:hypothetical protein
MGRQKDHADAVFARAGQDNLHFAAGLLQERVGHLQQDARAVAGVRLGPARAAVLEVAQHLERLLDDGVRFFALDVDHKAHPARIMLEAWVIKSLFRRRAGLRPRRVVGSLRCFTGHCLAMVAICSLILHINYAIAQ